MVGIIMSRTILLSFIIHVYKVRCTQERVARAHTGRLALSSHEKLPLDLH